MPHMGARETSLNNATFIHKYGFGLGFCGMAVFLFNREHPYGTGFVCLGFFILGAFFLSVGRVQPEKNALKYRRWFRWHAVSYSESWNAVSLGCTAISASAIMYSLGEAFTS
jgi:hypothetical protein